MYPIGPQTHKPTNYYWILVVFVLAMLFGLFSVFRSLSARVSSGAAAAAVPSASAVPSATVAPLAAATPASAAISSAGASAVPTIAAVALGVPLVTPKELTDKVATYRSRPIKIQGKVFFTGKADDGRSWIQIVDDSNNYVNGAMTGALPTGVVKGALVEITGVGAGLYAVTASNGKDYDQPLIDPISQITLVK